MGAHRTRGFSLLELMIVVAIIGILAAIAVPNFRAMQFKAKRAELPANVSGVWLAELAYDAFADEYLAVSMNPPSAFTAYGEADVDGDGVRCQYTASESQTALLRAGDENVF